MTRHKTQPNRPLLRTGLLAFFLVILFPPRPVWAGTCWELSTPLKEYQNSQAVFLGRAVSIKKVEKIKKGEAARVIRITSTIPIPIETKIARFDVEKAWKGIDGKTAEVRFESNQFKKGKRYLVYAVKGRRGLESRFCHRTRLAKGIRLEMMYLDKLSAGAGKLEYFSLLLKTARTHHERWIRIEALDMIDFMTRGSAPDISEGQEETLKEMAEDPNYEHRQYAQTIFDKIQRSRENRKFLP